VTIEGEDTTAPELRRAGFARNAMWLLFAEATGKIASFVFVVIVARELGARDYGAFAFAVAFVAPFYRLAAWGVDSTVISEVARDHRRVAEIFPAGLVLRVGFGTLALLSALVIAPFFVDGHQAYVAFAVLGAALLLDELSQFLSALFRSFERMEYHALVVLSNRVLSVILALVVLHGGGHLIAVCFTYLVGSFGAMVFGFVFLRRFLPPGTRLRPSRQVMRHMARTGAPLGIASALNMLAFRVDTVILQAVKGTVAVAQYAVAYRFFDSLAFVAYNLGDTAQPAIARTGKGGDATRTFTLATAAMLAFYLPLAVGYLFAGRWIVVTLFSETYRAAVPALMWLGVASAFYGLTYIARVGAIALGRRSEITWIAVTALAANLAMNAYAIPRWGGTGAGTTTCLTEVIEAALTVTLFLRTNPLRGASRAMLVPVAAAAASAAVLAVLGLRDGAALGGLAVVYLVTLVGAARLLVPDDAAELGRLLRNRFIRRPSSR
jgi:O-antigen/teichoic acid export membrane protein